MTMELNFRPRPVLPTTPTMMPAAAQVAATLSACFEPSLSAAISLGGHIAVSRVKKLTAKATTVAQNTDISGEKP